MPPESESLPESTRALLDAVAAISSDLDLRSVLSRIVEAATRLTGARYGALGVIGGDDVLVEFVTTGLSADERLRIGDLPHGRGILGLLIRHPEPIRLTDLTQHPDASGFPPNHPPMESFLGVPVRIRGTVFGNLYLTEKGGGEPFTHEDELLVVALAGTAGFVIDNARAYGLSERRRRWLEAAAELDEAVQPPVDFERALHEVARTARTMSGARAVAASIARDDVPPQLVAAQAADLPGVAAALEEVAGSDAGRLIDPRELTLDEYDVLVIPLRTHLAGGGLLVGFYDRGTAPLPLESRELFVSFADHAALSLDRAQAVDDRAEFAVTSDRERIARDLHDLVIQRLFATGLQLQGTGQLSNNPEVERRVDAAVEALDLTIKDIRGTIFELNQRQSDSSSLRAELRSLVREYAPLLRFEPTVRTSGPVDTAVPAEIREQLLPVLREALSNLARHADASTGEVGLAVDGGEVRLTVDDDGVGIDSTAVESGLRNARRRAAALGGGLELTSRQPSGTSFLWRVPLQ